MVEYRAPPAATVIGVVTYRQRIALVFGSMVQVTPMSRAPTRRPMSSIGIENLCACPTVLLHGEGTGAASGTTRWA
jgi:hypothetical protein